MRMLLSSPATGEAQWLNPARRRRTGSIERAGEAALDDIDLEPHRIALAADRCDR
jgi:hypothetical protein